MDESEITNLDVEFKRYLQILQPYLEHLINRDVIEMCNSWLQRLSNCKENEKLLRNKYIFSLCYQVARGCIDEPFIRDPPDDELPLISDDLNSEDSSTEIECVVIDSEEPTTKILFSNKEPTVSDPEDLVKNNLSENDEDKSQESFHDNKTNNYEKYKKDNLPYKQTAFCYTCPEMIISHRSYDIQEHLGEESENRVMNLIKKLRDIKAQNRVLQDELHSLKRNPRKLSHVANQDQYNLKLDNTTSMPPCVHVADSNVTLKSLNYKLHEIQESRNNLIDTIANLQDKIENFEEMKKYEIEDIEAKHKLEIIKIKTSVRDEVKDIYEKKADELNQNHETAVNDIECKYNMEIENISRIKDDIITAKSKEISERDIQIVHLKNQLEDQKNKFNVVLCKFFENSGDDLRHDDYKYKAEQLEKRLAKMENSKAKYIKAYDNKIAYLQREKQCVESSLQIQLARQRAQVVNDVTNESQTELNAVLDKLETKYKGIVATVQATAIHRRMQDQIALESILQAACGIQTESCHGTNNQFTVTIPHNQNPNCGNETSPLCARNKVGSRSLGENSLVAGYCLNEERMGQLFDRVYIPQRDNGEPLK